MTDETVHSPGGRLRQLRSVPLAVACGNYDRTRPLIDGQVFIEGCRPVFLPQSPGEIFFRAFAHEEFDVSELSLSSYAMRRAKGDCPYVGIPVFLSRAFRHSAIYVRTDRDITRPEDLRGRLVGVPEYQITAAVWVRGLLQEEYGIAPRDLRWVSGGLEMPGRIEKIPFTPPSGVSLEGAPAGKTLSGLLEEGRHPWLPASVYKAFAAAKDIAVAALSDPDALKVSLPSLTWSAERAQALMGKDFWPYGLAANAGTLKVFLRYHFEQGLSQRRLTPDELFAPSTASQWKV